MLECSQWIQGAKLPLNSNITDILIVMLQCVGVSCFILIVSSLLVFVAIYFLFLLFLVYEFHLCLVVGPNCFHLCPHAVLYFVSSCQLQPPE